MSGTSGAQVVMMGIGCRRGIEWSPKGLDERRRGIGRRRGLVNDEEGLSGHWKGLDGCRRGIGRRRGSMDAKEGLVAEGV